MNDRSGSSQATHGTAFPVGGGAVGRRMRGHDWSTSPLGEPSTWPPSLRSAVQLMLGHPQPMLVAWGPDLAFLYNDGYAPTLGDQQIAALGRPLRDVWSEIWDRVEPLVSTALGGEAISHENLHLVTERHPYVEDAWFTLSFSPLRDASGDTAGLFCSAVETTATVIAGRRQAFLTTLGDALIEADDPRAVVVAAVDLLGLHFGASRVAYGELQADNATVVLHAGYPHDVPPLEGPFRLDAFGLESLAHAQRGLPQLSDDVLRDPRQQHAAWTAIDVRAFLVVPLVRDGRLRALLYVDFRAPHRWRADELAVAEKVAGRIWAAVRRARTERALRASEALQRFRVALADSLRGLTSPSEVMAAVAQLLGPQIGVDQANYYLVDGDAIVVSDEWRTAESPGLRGRHALADFADTMVASSRAGEVLRIDDTRTVDDAARFAAAGMIAVLSAPLCRAGVWAGGFHVHQARPRSWTDDDEALVRETAERAWAEMERARAEASLRDSEAHLRALAAASHQALYRMSPDWSEMRQLDGGGFLADTREPSRAWLMRYVPVDDQPRVSAAIDAAIRTAVATETRFELEHQVRRADGSLAWALSRAIPIVDADGRLVEWFGAASDVTARHEAVSQLGALNASLEQRVDAARAEQKLWLDLFEASDTAIAAMSLEHRYLAVNPAHADAFEHLYGVRPTVGDDPAELLSARPEHRAAVRAAWARALGGERFTVVEAFGDPAFDCGHYELRFSPLHDDAGRLIGAYQFAVDVTARLQREAERGRSDEALRQSQKMEAVGRLTGGIAHDFNNMLAVVIGSLDLLTRRIGDGDAQVKRYADAAADGVRRAALLTKRLLAFSRQQPLQPEPIDTNLLVAGIAELLRGSIDSAITLETRLAADLWPTQADPNQLESALLNLAVNACDAMPDGGQLTVETHNLHVDARNAAAHPNFTAGRYVVITVRDTGCGMAEAVLAEAFDPFYTTKAIGQGSGLGLSQVYDFVKQSGGNVDIASSPGQGTAVKIYLRRLASAAPDRAAPKVTAALPVSTSGETILLVDDEPAMRQFGADALAELGYRVLAADSAVAALRLLDAHPEIALLFTDVVMPDLNGRKLAYAARRHRPALKVLFTTGYGRDDVARYGVLDPDVPLIVKPFTIEELAAKVREVIDGRAADL